VSYLWHTEEILMGIDDYDQLMSGLIDVLSEPEGKHRPELHLVPQSGVTVPSTIDVVAIRKKTGLSQPAFASRIGVPVSTLRNWEQGQRTPTGPARVLLALLEWNPKIVEEALGG
jgi:putative transcriptional regulator